jgi:hypothetical protein
MAGMMGLPLVLQWYLLYVLQVRFWSFHSMIQLGPFNLNLEVFAADLFCICSDLIWLSLVIESISCERVSLSKGFDWAPKGISLYTNM